jgi:hypothetical protein
MAGIKRIHRPATCSVDDPTKACPDDRRSTRPPQDPWRSAAPLPQGGRHTGGIYLDGEDEVARYTLAFEHLRATALSTAATVTLIEEIAADT